ncbi:hypothetical protein RB608_09335 [Nocardioides sp. LHD-245]|uniref:hypothetical protein n=1 Tax=Nocardioides sp. LHD-245 TaxID=3051387 RepID=UPI0027E0AF9C|nr:hypothetical protein [Nocardioides sp. LHD-245]
MIESGVPYAPPPPPNAPTPFAAPRRPVGSAMVLRHLASVVIALVLTPVGVLVFDYGAGKYAQERVARFDNSGTAGELVLMVVGALILMSVAASARISGLGPVLAGVLWGLVPFLWFLVDLRSFFDLSQDLPSTYYWFTVPTYLFPLVAAMLVGSGLAGRWRGRRPDDGR